MADLETNKETVRSFYELAFNERRPQEAVDRYLGDRYTQHNPMAADGPDAFVQFVTAYTGQFPQLRVELKRIVAEGDLVVTHGLIKTSPEDWGHRGGGHLQARGRQDRRALGRPPAGARDLGERQHDVLTPSSAPSADSARVSRDTNPFNPVP